MTIRSIIESKEYLFQNAVAVFQVEHQIKKAVEEMAELSCEFAYNLSQLNKSAIEEVVDSIIMLYQLLNYCNLFENKFKLYEAMQKPHNCNKIINLSSKVSRSLMWYLNKGTEIKQANLERLLDELLSIAENKKAIKLMEYKLQRLEKYIQDEIAKISCNS